MMRVTGSRFIIHYMLPIAATRNQNLGFNSVTRIRNQEPETDKYNISYINSIILKKNQEVGTLMEISSTIQERETVSVKIFKNGVRQRMDTRDLPTL